MFDLLKSRVHALELTFPFHSHQTYGKPETDNGKVDFVDCTSVEFTEIFSVSSQKRKKKEKRKKEIEESDSDLHSGDCDVEGKSAIL